MNKRFFKVFGLIAVLVVLAAGAGILMLSASPAIGAYGAEALRKIIGEGPVAAMEMTLFQLQDTLKSAEYHMGLSKPSDPFNSPAESQAASVPVEALPTQPIPATGVQQAEISSPAKSSASMKSSAPESAQPVVNPKDWALSAITDQNGKANWQPYLTDASGTVIAYRTYVHPDPSRPYAYTAIVAFDLKAVRLHYVLGTEEPYAPGIAKTSSGTIPEADQQPGLLVAAFNGGFKYEHGNSGSMANGMVSVPPRDGFGTLAIYRNGEIKFGEWGKDIQPSADMVAFRQNGPLLIQDGQINRPMLVDDPNIWGRTITGGTATFRSGLAISPDGRTLYYFAGQYLSAPILADAMEMVHPKSGIQLDINNYWVYFSSFTAENGRLSAAPLIPKAMVGSTGRFLRPYTRDFFYVTLAR